MLRASVFRRCGPAGPTTPSAKVLPGPASMNLGGFARPAIVTFVRHSESFNNVKHEELKSKDPHNGSFELLREPDPALTDRGVLQAQLVAQRLATEEAFADANLIVTSHMSRALKTAEKIQQAFQMQQQRAVPVIVDQDFHEIGGHYYAEPIDSAVAALESGPSVAEAGAKVESPKIRCIGTPGRTNAEVSAEFPAFQFRTGQDCNRGWWRGASKETNAEGQMRAAAVWNTLQQQALSGHVPQSIVVTHGYLYRVMMHVAKVSGLFANPPNRDFQLIQNTGITRIQFDDPDLLDVAFAGANGQWVSDPFVPVLRLRQRSLTILMENDGSHVKEIGSLACRNIPVADNPAT